MTFSSYSTGIYHRVLVTVPRAQPTQLSRWLIGDCQILNQKYMTKSNGNLGSGLGQAQTYVRVKLINGLSCNLFYSAAMTFAVQ